MFLEKASPGKLLNRFSKDFDYIDQQLPSSIGQFISCSLQIISALISICSVTPSFGVIMVGILSIYWRVMRYYRKASNSLKRAEALSRTPTIAHMTETLSGLPVIRSARYQEAFSRINAALLDDTTSASKARKLMDRWLCVHLELLGNSVVLCSALLAVITASKSGAAGLSISNALVLTGLLNWAVRNLADMEALIGSVERVLDTAHKARSEHCSSRVNSSSNDVGRHSNGSQYSIINKGNSIPIDRNYATSQVQSTNIPNNGNNSDASLVYSSGHFPLVARSTSYCWPHTGSMSFFNVSLKYYDEEFTEKRPLKSFSSITIPKDSRHGDSSAYVPITSKQALNGISFNISAGQHVSIVGRTGSGKR